MRITASRIPVAIGLFVTWMVVTWALEGRIETFLRPDAVFDRVLYAVVANLLIGVVGATCAIRWLWRTGAIRLWTQALAQPRGPSQP